MAAQDASAYVQQTDPVPNTKRNLIIVALFAALIIIVVIVLAVTHEFPEMEESDGDHRWWYDDYYWDYYGLLRVQCTGEMISFCPTALQIQIMVEEIVQNMTLWAISVMSAVT